MNLAAAHLQKTGLRQPFHAGVLRFTECLSYSVGALLMPILLEPGQRPTCAAVIGAFLLCKVFIQCLVNQRQRGDFALSVRRQEVASTGSRFDRKAPGVNPATWYGSKS